MPRAVDLLLENGTRLQGNLLLGSKQRLSDYLAGTGTFIALLDAVRVQDGDAIGDVAVNSGCVKAVRDSKVFASEPAEPTTGGDRWGGLRRSSITASAAIIAGPAAARASAGTPLLPAARHWLTQLAVDASLAPPDPRDLSPKPRLDEIWRSIATQNDMADAEIAVMIAMAYKLEMADLEQVTAEAIRCIPSKLARRLGVLPVRIDGRTLVVAVCDPESHDIEQQLGFVTKHDLRRVIATPADIAGAIDWYYADGAAPLG